MYLRRYLSDTLQKAMEHFPAALVTGPRQASKTTFLPHAIGFVILVAGQHERKL